MQGGFECQVFPKSQVHPHARFPSLTRPVIPNPKPSSFPVHPSPEPFSSLVFPDARSILNPNGRRIITSAHLPMELEAARPQTDGSRRFFRRL